MLHWLVPTLHTITSSHPPHDKAWRVLNTKANVSRKSQVQYLYPRQATAGCRARRKCRPGQNRPRQLTATLSSCHPATNGFSMSVTWSKTTRNGLRRGAENSRHKLTTDVPTKRIGSPPSGFQWFCWAEKGP